MTYPRFPTMTTEAPVWLIGSLILLAMMVGLKIL
ncbi:hypothetical protein EDF68_10337 [Ochrobactrum sp. BH3]|nr:hypothetical protein EDF68_10337 [Ochrobactrum sp. BH3]